MKKHVKLNKTVKIAAVQMASGPQLKANLMEAVRLVREAASKGAQLVVLPECFALMAMKDADNLEIAEAHGDGHIQNTLKQCAIDNNVWIVAGSIPLKTNTPEKASVSCLVFDNTGKIVARYDKIHLFDVDIEGEANYRESATFTAGDRVVVVDTPFGKLGLSICYDLRFPALYREMTQQGAEILLVPAAFSATTGKLHWEPLLKARAIENQCYVIAAAQGGYHVNGRETYGNTLAVDYLGQVQALRLKGNGVITMTIDLNAQHQLRQSFPVLKHGALQYGSAI